MPLQPFEGVQVEMLPEIDAIILRGRSQQLQDLAEIIKRLTTSQFTSAAIASKSSRLSTLPTRFRP
ncbi:MAG: hypothetical protein R3C56_10185 [Pirellulaceae bacterium]